jgi:cobalt transporter subunit CbtA
MRVLLAAIIAGMIAGAVAGAFQIWRVSPLIHAAEVYETKAETAATQWAPEDGVERMAYTLLANFIMGVGFAFVLAAAVMFTGRAITPRNGVLWGLIGFAVFTLAPAAGLAPELPGMAGADLAARQTWWWGTAIATAGGIALLVLARNLALKALGAVLIAAPHIVGAPHPDSLDSAVPAALAAQFAANSLAMMALFWVVLGLTLGWAMSRPNSAVES